jgi:hypothetical protein
LNYKYKRTIVIVLIRKNMKIHKKSSSKKTLITLATVALVLLISAASYAYYKYSHVTPKTTPGSSSKVNYGPATSDQQKAGQNTKNLTATDGVTGKPKPPGSQDSQPPATTGDTVPVIITAANQNGSTLSVRSLIEIVTSEGSCTLILTRGSDDIKNTSGIQALATSSTCKGFDIPTTTLSPGVWHIELDVMTNGKSGSASKDITIN